MIWTPKELDLAGFIMVRSRDLERMEQLGEFDHADELHRELWTARHELREIREELGR